MPLFQLRYSPPSLSEPETVLASDAIDAINQSLHRLAAQGVDRGILLLDGAVLHTFYASDPSVPLGQRPIDMGQLFASAGIYVFQSDRHLGLSASEQRGDQIPSGQAAEAASLEEPKEKRDALARPSP